MKYLSNLSIYTASHSWRYLVGNPLKSNFIMTYLPISSYLFLVLIENTEYLHSSKNFMRIRELFFLLCGIFQENQSRNKFHSDPMRSWASGHSFADFLNN
ncbi:unnamed protein product [Thelazia callipaeda]|uniref:Ovule protein n=1 Tax=Thelazia callipaeda TaxID=103827 RepID=A0A0N5CYL9_THECL|nr:unnamed protein product [Thelazia callipaeda]